MIPKIEVKPLAEKFLPQTMTAQQLSAKSDAITSLAADPYCYRNETLYKNITLFGFDVMFAIKKAKGIGFDIFYRVENDVLVLEMIRLH